MISVNKLGILSANLLTTKQSNNRRSKISPTAKLVRMYNKKLIRLLQAILYKDIVTQYFRNQDCI
jgi:hypothetical protein